MRTPRIYTPRPLTPGDRTSLDHRAAHYLLDVLRAKIDTAVVLFNGDGYDYFAQLIEIGKSTATARIESRARASTESPLHLTLAQGIARGERMDYSLQKAVELGVNRIVPLFCERTEVKLSGARLDKRREHWHGVIVAACEQSGRAHIPQLLTPRPLVDWLAETGASALNLVLSPGSTCTIKSFERATNVRLLVGPEGGLSDAELQQAETAGFERISLGPRTLRTETAGPAVLAALQVLWGDMG